MPAPLRNRAPSRRSLIIAAASAAVLVPALTGVAFAGGGSDGSSASPRWAISGSRPAWAASADQVGTPSATEQITFNVVLPLRDAAGAEALAAAVSDPTSPQYGKYVSPDEFNARFAPTTAQVNKVKDFLSGAGLHVGSVATGNRWVTVTGTTQQVEAAFSTRLRNYRYHGQTIREPDSALTVPHAMTGLISAVVGVGTEGRLRHPDLAPTKPVVPATGPSGAVLPGTPLSRDAVQPDATSSCSDYWGQHTITMPKAYSTTTFPTYGCGYTAADIRTAYGLQSSVQNGDTGQGITVAIIDAYGSATMQSDANALATSEGEPAFTGGQYTESLFTPFTNQSDCGGEAGWNEEESLDVEAVHAMAPGATIHYVGASDCETGMDDALNYVVQNHVADIVSNSYGSLGEDGLGSEETTEHSLFVQAAAEGMGFYFSTGDDGDNRAAGLSHAEPDYPSTDPYVTAVGGTSLAVSSSGAYDFEAAWGDYVDYVNGSGYTNVLPGTFLFGTGGGTSALFTQPAYQAGTVPTSLSKKNGSTAMRVVPDVSALADPELGFIIEVGGELEIIGGTSLACPVFAGVQALVSQGRLVPIGFANPELYALPSGAYHDVTNPSSTVAMADEDGTVLFTLGTDTSLTAATGFDDTTGRGTPNGLAFLLGERLLASAPTTPVIHASS